MQPFIHPEGAKDKEGDDAEKDDGGNGGQYCPSFFIAGDYVVYNVRPLIPDTHFCLLNPGTNIDTLFLYSRYSLPNRFASNCSS